MEQDQPQGRTGSQEAREGVGRLDLPSRVQAVIFDLDGTLIDSEPNYREVDSRYLLSKGIRLSDADWQDVVGMGGGPFIDFLRTRFGLEGNTDALIAEKDALYLDHAVGRTRAFPRMVELVRYLHLHGVLMGVGTSSRSRVLRRMLGEAGIETFFGATVGSDEVAHPKPDPDIFLEVARRLRVDPHRCLVLEDSQYGVQAALRAGMAVIGVPAEGTEHRPAFRDADLVFPGGPRRLDLQRVLERFDLRRTDVRDAGQDPLDPGTVERFRAIVWDFYGEAARQMPWRETDDPYEIMVSEFMLQQTQASRVEPRYREFLERYPRASDLARAPLQTVLDLWQGLGYNRRAKNLRDAARRIVDVYAGVVPDSVTELQTLPGVGPYTAAAVVAFGYERPVVMIETNIRRLFLHFFAAGRTSVTDGELAPLIAATLPHERVRHWYYALMDYGAQLGRLFPNANRRSSHYKRQSAFAGSVREVRGRIIRALSAHGELSVEQLERLAGPTDERFLPAIDGLERDGMVSFSESRVRLNEA